MIFAGHKDIENEVVVCVSEENMDAFLAIVNDDGEHYISICEDEVVERLGLASADDINYAMIPIPDDVFEGVFRLK